MSLLNKVAILWEWTPIILAGFLLNIAMSLAAVVIGTASGAFLGIAQVTHGRFGRRCARISTELFRNAPTLVILFGCMFLMPFELHVGSLTIPFPGWAKAILGLSLSKMGYVS